MERSGISLAVLAVGLISLISVGCSSGPITEIGSVSITCRSCSVAEIQLAAVGLPRNIAVATDIARKFRALPDRPRDRDGGAPVHGAIVRCRQRWFAGIAGLAGDAGRCGPCRSRRRVNATERVLGKSRSSHSE